MRFKVDKTYNVGDTVRYETFTGELRTVKVTEKNDDVKNNRSGFCGNDIHTTTSVWGYDDQIIRVFCKEQGRWKC